MEQLESRVKEMESERKDLLYNLQEMIGDDKKTLQAQKEVLASLDSIKGLEQEIETLTLRNQANDDPNLSFAKPPEVIPTAESPAQE